VLSYLPFEISAVLFEAIKSEKFGYKDRFDLVFIDLLRNYKYAEYEIVWQDHSERIRLDSKLVTNKTSIGIITAWNPRSVKLSDEENTKRNSELMADLSAIGCTFVKSKAHDPLNEWPFEEGFAVFGLTKSQIIELARKYEQFAVVYLESGRPSELVWCAK
jgi:hypothetical protein